MIILSAIVGVVLVSIVFMAFGSLLKEQGRTMADLRDANKRLQDENRQLTEALCAANGAPVSLEPKPKIALRPPPAPYFNRTFTPPVEVKIGEKMVKLG